MLVTQIWEINHQSTLLVPEFSNYYSFIVKLLMSFGGIYHCDKITHQGH